MQTVIGFTGAFGSGCSTACGYLRHERGFELIALSDPLKALWEKRNGNRNYTREDLQKLGDEIRKEGGSGAVVELAFEKVPKNGEHAIVIDGIRNVGEVEALREQFGYGFSLIAVLARKDDRWDRIGQTAYLNKGLDKDEFDDDDQRDWDEDTTYGQQVNLCVDKADILIDNGEGLKEFKEKVLKFVDLLTRKQVVSATEQEIFMNMAFAASHSSKCKKRHVGAVIVAGGQVVGVGYNENPLGTKPCVEEPTYNFECYRDILRNGHFADLASRGARCPKYGEPLQTKPGPPWLCEVCLTKNEKTNLEPFFFPNRAMSWCTAVHAELWALMSAGERAKGGTLYTTTFPCFQCTEKLIQGGIKEVYFTEVYPDTHSGNRLELASIKLHQFEGVRSISFERIFAPNRPD
ncbi:MAG TPA: deaminase [Terriglobales bacterium]